MKIIVISTNDFIFIISNSNELFYKYMILKIIWILNLHGNVFFHKKFSS